MIRFIKHILPFLVLCEKEPWFSLLFSEGKYYLRDLFRTVSNIYDEEFYDRTLHHKCLLVSQTHCCTLPTT